MSTASLLAIGAVAKKTGLTIHTIRAWERRFGVVEPYRSPKGTRRYSSHDVDKLCLLAEAIGRGHRISELAQLSPPDLQALTRTRGERPLDTPSMRFDRESRTAGPVIEQLLEATMALNGLRLEQLLTQQMQMLGGARFARNIASPLLQEIGARWMRGELTIAAEHLASNQLRRLLSSALISVPTQVGSPRVLVFTPEGERHEFGALIAAIVASGTGASVLYLGTDLPCDAVVEATRTVPTAALAMSVVTLQEGSQRRYLRLLREQVAPEVKIWIGGAAALQDESAEYMADLDDLEARLRVLGSAS